jgi:NodT family efflux transporter outer membrane factor (OMF) lipoprotein
LRLPNIVPCAVKLRHAAALVSCVAVLNACTVGNDYHPPKEELNDQWDALYKDAVVAKSGIELNKDGALSARPWVKQFNDETLSWLMEKALAGNNDLKVAKARIAEAWADEYYAAAQLYPQINADGSISRATLDTLSSSRPDTVKQVGVSGSLDLDFFGENRRRSEAAGANVQANEEDFAQARLDLLANVARNYSHLRAAQKLRALVLRNLDTQRDTLRITRALRKAQDVTELDVARVEAQISATEARLPQIHTEMLAAINRLGVLIGEQPGTLYKRLLPKKSMLSMPQDVVVLSPIATIAQRPDVRAAERRLAQASALSNAAFAELFPKLSLSAFFGSRQSDLFGSLSPWSATATGLFPLLDFGRIRAQMHGADARQEQAFYLYKQTVLLALEDTENNLTAYMNERRRNDLLQNVAIKQARAVAIASEQYRAGIVTQLDLLDAQRNQLDAESNWVLSLQTETDNLIGLYHALGQSPVQTP